MAGPSVVVRVLGDLKGLSGSFAATSKQAETASTRIRGSFSSVLGTLNRTGVLGPFGESLAAITESMDNVAEHAKGIGTAMLGVGGTLVGVGVGLAALGSKDQAAHQQLQAAVEATGKSYEDYAGQVEAAIKHQEHFGRTANETQDALRILTQATHDPAKALQLLNTASDIAAAKHEDLSTAAQQLGKVYNGNTKLLKEYGIAIDKSTGKTKDGKTAVQALADVTAGQASAAADTFTGKLDAVKAKVEDTAAAFGQKYGPAITATGTAITVTGSILKIFQGTTEAATAATEAATVATEAQTVALDETAVSAGAADVALLPIIATVGLIVLAIAALGVAAYAIYRNWSTIWSAMKAAVKAVWDWIKNNWPLLLAILLGPIGLAADLIIKNWDKIKQGAADVWQWIKDGWNGLVGFFTGLPGRIASIAKGLWKGIADAFADAINFIIHIWNGLQFTVPGVSVFGHHFGGFTLGLPDIPDVPHMAAGGLITRDGLIYAHAGEAVIPAPGRTSPAMVFNGDNHFHTEVDVELFMRRTAWIIQTQRI